MATTNNPSRKNQQKGDKSTWSGAFGDIVVHSITKGQFPLALMPIMFLGTLWLIPEDQRLTWLRDVGNSMKGSAVIGWTLSVVLSIVWYIASKAKRQATQTEFNRLNAENDRLRKELSSAKKSKQQTDN
jgi:cell shape-determining protein MreC